ncbi:unnamed protein product [Allacma fusca]|uniref:RRM domain-containing protein n=1 Tax=Allacma fusca TaxID=39272 RepID=A0A8J2L8M7_9HEXA|nr:unnamed protein product [Allacma fusca]
MSNSVQDFDKVESFPDVSAAQQMGMTLGDETQPRTLYVGNLDAQMSEEFLMVLFGQIGQIRGCKIIHEPNGDPYAFLEFYDHTAAAAALGAMNRRSCFGKELMSI